MDIGFRYLKPIGDLFAKISPTELFLANGHKNARILEVRGGKWTVHEQQHIKLGYFTGRYSVVRPRANGFILYSIGTWDGEFRVVAFVSAY